MKQPEKVKKYGSIPHLPGSKLGPGDHHVDAGQNRICTEAVRDKHDWVIVQEKYDGANVGVENDAGQIVALTRRGFLAKDSNFEQHRLFAQWVEKNSERFRGIIAPGDKIFGEWLLQVHGVKYDIETEPFVVFDYFSGRERMLVHELANHVKPFEFSTPRIIAIGNQPRPVESIIGRLTVKTNHPIIATNEPGNSPEGLIYRVERLGKLIFLAKYVRNDFEPGAYLPEMSGGDPVFNFNISNI